MFFYQPPKGSNCFSRGGGGGRGGHTSISKETFSHLCFLRGGGGSDPLSPLDQTLDRCKQKQNI